MKMKKILLLSLAFASITTYFILKMMKSKNAFETMMKTAQLTDLDNLKLDLAKLEGKVFVISFFQTWCGDCVKENPELKKLQEEFDSTKFQVILVSDEPMEKLKLFDDRFQSGLKIYQSSVALKDLGVSRFPTTFLIDKKGNTLIHKVEGINWYTPEIIEKIKSNLN